jgi:hypothetical protein
MWGVLSCESHVGCICTFDLTKWWQELYQELSAIPVVSVGVLSTWSLLRATDRLARLESVQVMTRSPLRSLLETLNRFKYQVHFILYTVFVVVVLNRTGGTA